MDTDLHRGEKAIRGRQAVARPFYKPKVRTAENCLEETRKGALQSLQEGSRTGTGTVLVTAASGNYTEHTHTERVSKRPIGIQPKHYGSFAPK